MLKKNLKLLLTLSGTALLCSCYNMRKDPGEPLDKVTFGEACEHYLLGAHDCRRSPEKCTPICIKDVEQFDENAKEEMARWIAFKNTPPYIPRRSGIMLLDRSNKILAGISMQIRNEIVIPYRELAEQGHIEAYKTFRADVDHAMKTFGLDRANAVAKVYAYWASRYGEARCQQLLAAFPCMERMRADRQLAAAFLRNEREIVMLIAHVRRDVAQLKAAAKDSSGIIAITAAGTQTLAVAVQLSASLGYLGEFCKEEAQKDSEIRIALQDIRKYNKLKN